MRTEFREGATLLFFGVYARITEWLLQKTLILTSSVPSIPSQAKKSSQALLKNFSESFWPKYTFQTNLQTFPRISTLPHGHPDTFGPQGGQRDEIVTRCSDRLRPSLKQFKIDPPKYCREANIQLRPRKILA